MFGKLLKYDFRSMGKQFAFIWPAALALALVNHFTINSLDSANSARETVSAISMLIYVAILMAMFIVALVFAIQRFHKGLLGDEGYLMHTLPVKPWQLIGSKLLCAVVTTFLSVLVALASILVIMPWDQETLGELFRGLKFVFTHWNIQATHSIIGVLEFCLMMMVSFATGFLQLYLAMSVGHLFNKNRVAMSVIAFIVINTVVSTLLGRLLSPMMDAVSRLINGMSGPTSFHAAMWIVIAGELIFCALYFAGTAYILHRKLNLE